MTKTEKEKERAEAPFQHKMSGGVDSSASKDITAENPFPPKNQRPSFFLSFWQFYCLSIAITISAIGLVSFKDMAFVIFSFFYTFILSKVAFPLTVSTPRTPVFKQDNKWLKSYIQVAAIIGLLLPTGYIFEGILEGDEEGAKFAAPHLFLLCFQVFMEGFAFSSKFSLGVSAFVPISYNTRRIFTLVDWVRDEFGREGIVGSMWRLQAGQWLAVVNLVLWCFNLFCFLLPVYLPLAFEQYYKPKV
ncbi:hypothetical protein AMTRI_Chr07g30140 [Amborella trichopoda]